MDSLNETLHPEFSYWLAIDENLDSHKFRCIEYTLISEKFYMTEYGTVSLRRQGDFPTAHIKPKGRSAISIVYEETEEPSLQEMLSLLVFWAANPLFLAVPALTKSQEQVNQETLF